MIYNRAKLPPDQYVNCILYGKRYTAEEAKRVGIIQEYSESDEVLDSAVELANDVMSWQEDAYDRNILAKMKEDLYHDTIEVFINHDLSTDVANLIANITARKL